MTDWNAWSRIVEAAQDPRHREAVQAFLAETELSADIPSALDERFLAPRRPGEASEEQCAYLFCNLGFAALARPSGDSAAFAMACGRVAERLAPELPDITLRRLFLSAKGNLVRAMLTDRPHIHWDDAAGRCVAYLDAIDQYLETLPAEALEGNAMAAYSFTGKTLSQIAASDSTAYYAGEIAALASAALRVGGRLPQALEARIRSAVMPGTDAFAFFREKGAAAERALEAGQPTPDRPPQPSPSSAQAVDAWCAERLADSGEGHWTHQSGAGHRLAGIRQAWALEAIAAAESGDGPGCLGAVDRFGGFLADSFLRDWQWWVTRFNASHEARPRSSDQAGDDDKAAAGGLLTIVDEIFDALGEDTALVHVALGGEGVVTLATRRRQGELVFAAARGGRNAARLRQAHRAWSRAHYDAFHENPGDPDAGAACAAAFTSLLEEIDESCGEVLRNLLEDDLTQIVALGDGFVDLPLHAVRTGNGDARLIDRVPVIFAPSLTALRICIGRPSPGKETAEAVSPVSGAFRRHAAAPGMLELDARLDHNARLPFDSVIRVGEQDLALGEFVAGLDLSHCDAVSSLACESTLPSMLRAPGLDLATLFLAAGARSVLASSWQTNDDLAAEMTQAYFGYRTPGRPASAAFRQALSDLRSGHSSLPDYLWAGMRLVGAP